MAIYKASDCGRFIVDWRRLGDGIRQGAMRLLANTIGAACRQNALVEGSVARIKPTMPPSPPSTPPPGPAAR